MCAVNAQLQGTVHVELSAFKTAKNVFLNHHLYPQATGSAVAALMAAGNNIAAIKSESFNVRFQQVLTGPLLTGIGRISAELNLRDNGSFRNNAARSRLSPTTRRCRLRAYWDLSELSTSALDTLCVKS